MSAPPIAGSNFSGPDAPGWDLYSQCIHCGLCLNHCPTYRVLGQEMDSPRGRIRQVLDVDQGRLAIGASFVTHIERCLDCRACETACPSGVQYGRILERARAQIEQHYPRGGGAYLMRKFAYGGLLKHPAMLRFAARLLRFYQRSPAQWAARKLGILRLLDAAQLDALAPRIDRRFFTPALGKVFPAHGVPRGRVAFHAGCIQQVAFAELNRATVRVLQANGIEVHVPRQQGCCGALHVHAGLRDDARQLARKNIDAMLALDVDAIITNAAGCGSALKEYDDLLSGDAAYKDKATEFRDKVRDISEYLAQIGMTKVDQPIHARVIYQDACHLLHGQKIKSQPRELLQQAGAQVVELAHPDQCCGSAGSYNITQTELSMQILDRKMDDISAVVADLIVTGNVGCQLQLRAGMNRRGARMPVLHIVELLDRCYAAHPESAHPASASNR